jgi:hypothetical protein
MHHHWNSLYGTLNKHCNAKKFFHVNGVQIGRNSSITLQVFFELPKMPI